MDKSKLILPISILLGCIILGGFYYASEINKQNSIEKQQQIKIEHEEQQLKTEQGKQEIKETKIEINVSENEANKLTREDETKDEITQQEAQRKAEEERQVQAQRDEELILLNYKLDVDDLSDSIGTLTEIVYNNTETVCSNIIASRTTRNNIYYIVLDELARLEMEYEEYRDSIQYIDNNLHSWNNAIQIVKDKCASVGYEI